jgi:hypothetical protein
MIILDLPDGSTIVSGSSTVGVEFEGMCGGIAWRFATSKARMRTRWYL